MIKTMNLMYERRRSSNEMFIENQADLKEMLTTRGLLPSAVLAKPSRQMHSNLCSASLRQK